MTANGFLDQRTARPVSLGAVILLHGAAIAGVLLIKGPEFFRADPTRTEVINVELPKPPPPVPPEPVQKLTPQVPTKSFIDVPPRVVPTPVPNVPVAATARVEPSSAVIGTSDRPAAVPTTPPQRLVTIPPREVIRTPVRMDAQFDPRFAGALQPPYPDSERRAEREGSVRIQVTIGPDGRVTAAQKLSATSDAFWRVTERQALGRWRFKPATVDGKPVQSSKVLSLRFRLDEA